MQINDESIISHWAVRNFGCVDLGDERRERRAISMAMKMLANPSGSLPMQMKSGADLQATYGLLHQEAVTHEALIQPHCAQTLASARTRPEVLFIQDTTHADYSQFPTTQGLGPIGDGRGQGYLIHTVIAVNPETREVLGLAAQEPFVRVPRPADETKEARAQRPRESDIWSRAVRTIGCPPEGSRWIHVGDRGSDIFLFMEQCRASGCHFLIRAAQDRSVQTADMHFDHLFSFARGLRCQAEFDLELSGTKKQPKRTAHLCLSFAPLTLQTGKLSRDKEPLPVWVIRVWEPTPPAGVDDPLEWILLTSVPTETVAEARERVEWYRSRWLVEDYHQCLKTGCGLEERRLQSFPDLKRLLGFLAVVAVFLLQLRDRARLNPDTKATDELPPDLVAVVAHLGKRSVDDLTIGEFWLIVARQGGYLGRRRDGPPGWKTLWRGWLHVDTLLAGVRLASHVQLPQALQRSD